MVNEELDIKQAFLKIVQYRDELEEYPDIEEIYQKARFGINIKFDIYDYIYDIVNTSKMKSGIFILRGDSIDMTEFWTEIEKRTRLIIKWIEENLDEEGIVSVYK